MTYQAIVFFPLLGFLIGSIGLNSASRSGIAIPS